MAADIRIPPLAELVDRIPDKDKMTAPELIAAVGCEQAKEVFRHFNQQNERLAATEPQT